MSTYKIEVEYYYDSEKKYAKVSVYLPTNDFNKNLNSYFQFPFTLLGQQLDSFWGVPCEDILNKGTRVVSVEMTDYSWKELENWATNLEDEIKTNLKKYRKEKDEIELNMPKNRSQTYSLK